MQIISYSDQGVYVIIQKEKRGLFSIANGMSEIPNPAFFHHHQPTMVYNFLKKPFIRAFV